MAEAKKDPQVLTVEQAAALANRTPRWVQTLVKEGFIKQERRGEYRIVDFFRGVMDYYEDRLSRTNKAAAANRASEARTRQIEQQMEIKTRNLVPRSDFYQAQDFVVQQHRAAMAGLPARITREIELRRKIEAEIDDVFRRTAENIERAAFALEEGGTSLEALGTSGTGPMGGEE